MRFLRYRNRNLQSRFIIVFNNTWYHTVADSIQYHIFEILAFNIFCDTGSSEMLYPSDNEFVDEYFQPFFNKINIPNTRRKLHLYRYTQIGRFHRYVA